MADQTEAAECPSQIWSKPGRKVADCVKQCPFPRGLRVVDGSLICGICPLETPFIMRETGMCIRAGECGKRSFWVNNFVDNEEEFYKNVNRIGCVVCETVSKTVIEGRIVYQTGEGIVLNSPADMELFAVSSAGDAVRTLFKANNGSFYRSINNSEYLEPAWVNVSKLHEVTQILPALRNFLLITQDGYLFYDWEKDAAGNVTRCNVEAAGGDSARLFLAIDVCEDSNWDPVGNFSHCPTGWKQQIVFYGKCNAAYCGDPGYNEEVLEGKILKLNFHKTAIAQIMLNRNEAVFTLANGSLYVTGTQSGCGLTSDKRIIDPALKASKFISVKSQAFYVTQTTSNQQIDTQIHSLQACDQTAYEPDELNIFPVDLQEQIYCPGLGCEKKIYKPYVLLSNGTVRVKEYQQLSNVLSFQEPKTYIGGQERRYFDQKRQFILSEPNLTVQYSRTDQGYCFEGQCICSKGFVISHDNTECLSVCGVATALLKPINKCVAFNDVLYRNYSDFGNPAKEQQVLICLHSSFIITKNGCQCPALFKYVEHGLILRQEWRCVRDCGSLYLSVDGRNCVPSCPAQGWFTWEETHECTKACGPNQMNLSVGAYGPDYCACFDGTYRNGRFCDVLGPRCPRLSSDQMCVEICGLDKVVGRDGYKCMDTCEGEFKYWFKEKVNGDWFCRGKKWIYVKFASIGAAFVPVAIGFIGWAIVLIIQAQKPSKNMIFRDSKGRAVDGEGKLIKELNLVSQTGTKMQPVSQENEKQSEK